MVKPKLKLAVGLAALLASGPLWAPPAGSKTDCNQNSTLTELQVLDFGDLIYTGAGTVDIDPITGTRSATGLVTLVGAASARGILQLTTTTTGDCSVYLVGQTVPKNVTLTDALGNTITISTFTVDPADAVGAVAGVPGSQTLTIYVGGSLTVAGTEPGGTYTGTYAWKTTFQ